MIGLLAADGAFGFDQSHTVMTTLRSRPCGRGGFVAGSSPLAIRSVQSPSIAAPRNVPKRSMVSTMSLLAGPDWMRLNHASAPDLKSPSMGERVRVAWVPMAWQWKQPSVLNSRRNWGWDFISGLMSLPPVPVPGNSPDAGILSIDSQ